MRILAHLFSSESTDRASPACIPACLQALGSPHCDDCGKAAALRKGAAYHKKVLFYCQGGPVLEQAAQRGGGDVKNPAGHGLREAAPADPA